MQTPAETHTVEKSLILLESAGIPARRDLEAMRLHTPASGTSWFREQPFASRKYAVLAPTSAWPAKQWPADRFAALAQSLTQLGLAVIITGSASERPQIAPLLELAARNPMVVDRVGATDIAGLMAILEHAALVVANDSAALHIGVGFHRPVIGLYGPTNPKLAAPYRQPDAIMQHIEAGDEFYFRDGRSAKMMHRIGVDEVLERAKLLLQL